MNKLGNYENVEERNTAIYYFRQEFYKINSKFKSKMLNFHFVIIRKNPPTCYYTTLMKELSNLMIGRTIQVLSSLLKFLKKILQKIKIQHWI